MSAYYISYNLDRMGDNQVLLRRELQRLDGCFTHSGWFIQFEGSAQDLATLLRPHLERNDSLFIVEVSGDWDMSNLPQAKRWLANHSSHPPEAPTNGNGRGPAD
ncbi:MAG: hypothetical protein EOP14_00330 [Pseudomonas sp.]|nr:MAG: hypothetical protein EOP14_00330 [Pseudomonas sp.]